MCRQRSFRLVCSHFNVPNNPLKGFIQQITPKKKVQVDKLKGFVSYFSLMSWEEGSELSHLYFGKI